MQPAAGHDPGGVSDDELHQLSNDLVVLSARLVREVRRTTADVSGAGARLLSLLDEVGPTGIGRLAELDRCSQPTMSGLVKGLVAKQWVDRRPHPEDARASLIELNARGREVLAEVRARNAAMVAERVTASGHSPAELAATVALLRDISAPAPPST